MDWNILLSFALGVLATLITTIINNRYQAQQKDKDRQEQRREARVQLEMGLIQEDIKLVEQLIDESLRLFRHIETTYSKYKHNGSTADKAKLDIMFSESGEYHQVGKLVPVASKAVSSLGKDILNEYQTFNHYADQFIQLFFNSESNSINEKRIHDTRQMILESAGTLHTLLRNKLISLQDGK